MTSKNKGFTLIELLTVVAIVGVIATIAVSYFSDARLRAKNASIVSTMSSIPAVVDADKYPGSLESLCLDFEPGGEFSLIRKGVEHHGGIWHCDSTAEDYRIYAKLNQKVVLSFAPVFSKSAHAQEESMVHDFGNYYCLNSEFVKRFTHWPGDSLAFPSCDDRDYIDTPVDPAPTPDPTPDPNPETSPPPPLENNGAPCTGNKVYVCHFGKSICVSQNAANNGHAKHGDSMGACS